MRLSRRLPKKHNPSVTMASPLMRKKLRNYLNNLTRVLETRPLISLWAIRQLRKFGSVGLVVGLRTRSLVLRVAVTKVSHTPHTRITFTEIGDEKVHDS